MSGHYIERWECGHVAGQCRCPGPKEERTRPGKCPECATPPDQPAMPERVWLNPVEGIFCSDGYQFADQYPYVPESRLREVEAECAQRERAAFESGVELRDNFGRRPTSQEVNAAFAAYLKTREGSAGRGDHDYGSRRHPDREPDQG